jgi:transposase-like protein
MEKANNITGLTPQQEKTVALILSGRTVTEIAQEIGVDRGTLYNWTQKINFQTYYDNLRKEIQDNVRNNLMKLHVEALEAIKAGLQSNNDNIKIKTAIWLIERLESQKIGETDLRKKISSLCYSDPALLAENWGVQFDKSKFNNLCRENGIEP